MNRRTHDMDLLSAAVELLKSGFEGQTTKVAHAVAIRGDADALLERHTERFR